MGWHGVPPAAGPTAAEVTRRVCTKLCTGHEIDPAMENWCVSRQCVWVGRCIVAGNKSQTGNMLVIIQNWYLPSQHRLGVALSSGSGSQGPVRQAEQGLK